MSSPAASPAKPVKGKAKKTTPKKPMAHPKYIEMVEAAVGSLKERSGSSRQAIEKYIKANYAVADNAGVHMKQAIKRGVIGGQLKQVKGTGASGSFKLADKPKKAPKKKALTGKKPAAKKAKRPAAAKKAAKKPAAKKATKKPAAKKTPKKAAKKPAKKAAVKKPAAKKVAKKAGKKGKK